MDENRVRRIEDMQQHVLRLCPLDSQHRYKSADVAGMHRFLGQVFLSTAITGMYGGGSGSVDPKAFGTVFHDQVAGWTAWRPSAAFPTLAKYIEGCLPQVRQLIAHFQRQGYVGIGANVVVADPLLNYATPVDILLAPAAPVSTKLDFIYLVELKTTHTLKRARAQPTLHPISQHLECETPETFASMQAVLPCIRLNELIAADPILATATVGIRVVPLVVVVRMDAHQVVTAIEEVVVPLGMQTTAFRDELHAHLPQLRIATSSRHARSAPPRRRQ